MNDEPSTNLPEQVPPPMPRPFMPPPLPPALAVSTSGYSHIAGAVVAEPPRIWPVFIAPALMFAATFAIGIIIGVGVMVYRSATGERIDRDDPQQLIEAALTQPAIALPMFLSIAIATGAIALLAARHSPMGIKRRLVLRASTTNPFTLLLLCIGTVCAGGAVETLMIMLSRTLHLEPGGSIKIIEDLIRNSSGTWIVLLAIVVSIGPGIGEELMFRGYVQSRLHLRLGPKLAIAIAAVMFGIAHFDPMHTIVTTPLGAYMGWAAYRTGSTRTSIACHIFNNLAAVTLAAIPAFGETDLSIAMLWIAFFAWLAIGFVVTLIAHKLLPPAPPPEEYHLPRVSDNAAWGAPPLAAASQNPADARALS